MFLHQILGFRQRGVDINLFNIYYWQLQLHWSGLVVYIYGTVSNHFISLFRFVKIVFKLGFKSFR